MAIFVSTEVYSARVDLDRQEIISFERLDPTDYRAEGTFSTDNSIALHKLVGDPAYVGYIGYVGDGWLGASGGTVYFFSNSSTPPSAPITYSTGSFTVCFLAGSRVATPCGDVAVEQLRIGDCVLTLDGRAVAVRWIGVQTVVSPFCDPLHSYPIRISRGALDEGLPMRDLLVSPDHAILVDGLLVQASALMNGTTILRMTDMPERFTYYHVELADHSLILTEGVPAETFVDNVSRRRFDNHADYVALYGDAGSLIPEMALPRVKSARQMPRATSQRLADRAAALGQSASAAAAA